MNNRTIEKLRRRFIAISMVALFLAMFFIGGSIWIANFVATRNAIRSYLDSIVDEEGNRLRPDLEETYDENIPFDELMLANMRDTSGFWVINYDIYGTPIRISGVYNRAREQQLVQTSMEIDTSNPGYGHSGEIFYKSVDTPDGLVVAFMDAAAETNALARLLYITFVVCLSGLAVTYILVVHFSHMVVASEVENAEKQKDFITNASHELKTPLAVIRANTEMSQMINGEDEWSESTMKQIDHMNGLIQNLVMISKAQEIEDKTDLSIIDVSSVVEGTVKTFESVAAKEELTLTTNIVPEAKMKADASKIMQLTTLLVDNAIKYCDDGGTVKVELAQPKKGSVRLTVINSYKDGANVDYNKFFERFYREDKSHNIDKGGYGIGLSIADNLCRQYNGSIKALWKNGEISFVCLLN